MIKAFDCAVLATALEKLKQIVKENEEKGQRTVIFCEDRLSLAAERTVCAAVGGSFLTSVYTFARFLSSETGKSDNVLSAQGSAMAVRRLIEEHKNELKLFKKLSATGAAQAVYDTIALLYSSRVSAEDVNKASLSGEILGGKLYDLAIIYSAYEKYLKDSGKQDRNGYLKQLGGVIEKSEKIHGSTVIFLGFQAFTCTITECARAAFSSAKNVYGLFISGAEDVYVKEASASFIAAAKEFGGAEIYTETGERNAEAEALRRGIFNPESFYRPLIPCTRVRVYEAADGEEELEFIAACIKRHVLDGGERYAKISVMLPDLDDAERELSRIFKRYRIPYYADRQLTLSEHPLCDFIINYLLCALSGCRAEDVDAVISSPFFPAERSKKDVYRNYALRLANFRGGVKREPKKEITENLGFDYEAVISVREKFLEGLSLLTSKGVKSGICRGVRALLEGFEVQKKLEDTSKEYCDERPAAAQFSARAYDSVVSVLDEAQTLIGEDTPLKEFIKILKSGFSAMKISLIPPKSDAVFVGDLATTANTGSSVVFAARLTGAVPGASNDCALLTDREISALEAVNLNISPKIRQVNARRRETIALNICSFRERLYLTYPARLEGEESGASEIIAYAEAIFADGENSERGKKNGIKPASIKKLEKGFKLMPYYCSEKLPAIRRLQKLPSSVERDSLYRVLCESGFKTEADAALEKPRERHISCGQKLYLSSYGSISPTQLETYFSCPYKSFIERGLGVSERVESTVRPVDTGDFIHAVLQDLAPEVEKIQTMEQLTEKARELAAQKISVPPYSALTESLSGAYTAERLTEEAVRVSQGMYEQLKNSSFKVFKTEYSRTMTLKSGVKIYGKIDRVDYGKTNDGEEIVRIIDYKTGFIEAKAVKYYAGVKLQLPLYLLAASENTGKKAAGAYYFPASVNFKNEDDGVFRLQGFMDGSEQVVYASDSNLPAKKKSQYITYSIGAKKSDGVMSAEDFAPFLEYSLLVSDKGAGEMLSGNITPSPVTDTCEFCKAGGSCNFAVGRDGEERGDVKVKCSQIAQIVRDSKGVK